LSVAKPTGKYLPEGTASGIMRIAQILSNMRKLGQGKDCPHPERDSDRIRNGLCLGLVNLPDGQPGRRLRMRTRLGRSPCCGSAAFGDNVPATSTQCVGNGGRIEATQRNGSPGGVRPVVDVQQGGALLRRRADITAGDGPAGQVSLRFPRRRARVLRIAVVFPRERGRREASGTRTP